MTKDYKEIYTRIEDGYMSTKGVEAYDGYEFKLSIGTREIDSYRYLLAYIREYLKAHPERTIKHNETFEFHSWLIKFIVNENEIEIWELNPTQDDYVLGAETGLTLYEEQKSNCADFNVEPIHPRFSQMVVVSDGVDHMQELEAVRYASPEHMSGWWVTTDLYNGDIKTLKVVHLSHFIEQRPDLVYLLGLPYGFGFRLKDNKIEVWLDEAAAKMNE